jgi:hypothetical protein
MIPFSGEKVVPEGQWCFYNGQSLRIHDTPYDQKSSAHVTYYIMLNERCILIVKWFTMTSVQIRLAAITLFIRTLPQLDNVFATHSRKAGMF